MTFICIGTFGQSISYNFSVDRTYRTLKANDFDGSQNFINFGDSITYPSIFYTTGFNWQKPISKSTIFSVGVLIAKTGYQTIKLEREPEVEIKYYTFTIKREYLNLPISVKWQISKNKIQTFLITGISTNIFLNSNHYTTIKYNDDSIESKINKSRSGNFFNISLLLGAGIIMPINDIYQIQINPVFRRSITKYDQFLYDEYIYSYGINFGINYKF